MLLGRERYQRRLKLFNRILKVCHRVVLPSRLGTHSRWASRVLGHFGHEVVVANPQKVRLIAESNRKTDVLDARTLARLVRIDPSLLSPISHRAQEVYPDLAKLRARELLVRTRTKLINAVRGIVKATGSRLGAARRGHSRRRWRMSYQTN
jgi:transposase